MRLLPVLAAAVLAAAFLPASAGAVSGPFHADGRWLKDARGRTVIVHGLQVAHKQRPYHPSARQFGPRDARLIASLGLDVVRLPWFWSGLEPRRGRRSAAYRREIVREVRDLGRAGVLTLLEAHQDVYSERLYGTGFPNWATFTLGGSRGPRRTRIRYAYPAVHNAFASLYRNRRGIARAFAGAWTSMARAVRPYRGRLLGYDLMNEPWTGGAGPGAGCSKLCARFDRELLGPFQTRLARAVRRADRRSIVFYEPHQLFDFGARTALRRAPRAVRPAGFAFHAYCAPRRGRLLRPNDESRSPGYRSCLRELSRVFSHAAATSGRLRAPALLDEFGDTGDAGIVERQLDRADRDRIGWVYWAYKDWADVPGGIGDGTLFRGDRGMDTFRAARAAMLARAYPEATAGEPLRWEWDRDTAGFDLDVRPDPRVHAPTVISLPVRSHYPDGYEASVLGGDVVSAPGARKLEVEASPGTETLSVHVQPAAPG